MDWVGFCFFAAKDSCFVLGVGLDLPIEKITFRGGVLDFEVASHKWKAHLSAKGSYCTHKNHGWPSEHFLA